MDKGLLLIERLGPNDTSPLRVVTSKQVCFNDAFGGQGLAMMMCALGYASVVEDLVHAAAELGDDAGTPFPSPGTQKTGPAPADGSMLAETVKELVDHAATSVKACVDAGLESSKKAQAGTYDADDLAKDVVSMAERMVREGATAVKIGLGAFTNRPKEN